MSKVYKTKLTKIDLIGFRSSQDFFSSKNQ